MNSENQNNGNLNNEGINSFSLGVTPNVSPQQPATPNMGMGPTPMAGTVNPTPAPQAPSEPEATVPPVGPNPVGTTPASVEQLSTLEPFVANSVDQMPTPSAVGNEAPNPTPTPNPAPAATPDAIPNMGPTPFAPNNLGPVEQPIPGTTYTANGNVNSNGFVEPNKVESVGTEAPQQQNNKENKPMNKILFIVIIVVLLAAIAYGVYYYLSLSKRKSNVSVMTNNLQYAVNDVLSSNITDYATITGTNPKNCTLNTANVDMTMAGNYEYTITCEDNVYRGIITVADNNLPTATPKDVVTSIPADGATATNYTANDFIEENSCSMTNCTYTFAEEYDFNSLLATAGTYSINIVVTDESGKTGNVTANLTVLVQAIRLYLNCTKTEENVITTDHIAFGNTLEFINYGYRTSEFTITDEAEFRNLNTGTTDDITYNGVTGKPTFDETNKKLTLRSDLNTDILNTEAGGAFPTKYQEVSPYYQGKGYTCTMETAN